MPTSVARWTTFSEDEATSFSCKDMGVKGGKMMNLLDAGPSKKVTDYTLASEPFQGRVHQLGPSSQLQILAKLYNHLPSLIGTNPN